MIASGFTVTTTLSTDDFPFKVSVYVKCATPAKDAGGTYVMVPLTLIFADPIFGFETALNVQVVQGSFDRTFNVKGSPGEVVPESSTPPDTKMLTVAVDVSPGDTDDSTLYVKE